MKKISTGIKDLDNLIDCAHIGDNVVWEGEAGTSEYLFYKAEDAFSYGNMTTTW